MFKKSSLVWFWAWLVILSGAILSAQSTALGPMAADTDPSFEVATIRLHTASGRNPRAGFNIVDLEGRRYNAHNVSLEDLIKFSYILQNRQLIGLPARADEVRYDISALMEPEGTPNGDQLRTMVRKLLAERFKLATHTEKRQLSVYALTLAKGGAKLPVSDGTPSSDTEHPVSGGTQFVLHGVTVAAYVNFLQRVVDRPVVDRTSLPAATDYDFDLTFLPDDSMLGGRYRPSSENLANPEPNLFTAIQEQLGLKLTPEQIPADVLVIDHFEAPSEN